VVVQLGVPVGVPVNGGSVGVVSTICGRIAAFTRPAGWSGRWATTGTLGTSPQ